MIKVAFFKKWLFLIGSCCQKFSVLCNPWKNIWLQDTGDIDTVGLKELVTAAAPWKKKSPYMKEWMTEADSLKKASTLERMAGRP